MREVQDLIGDACQCRRGKRCRSSPWVVKTPGRRAWPPTPDSDWRNTGMHAPWGSLRQSDTATYWQFLVLPACVQRGDPLLGGRRDGSQFIFKKHFWLYYIACGVLVPRPGIWLGLSAAEVWSPNTRSPGNFWVYFILLFCIYIFRSHCTACGILVSWPGIKPKPPALEALSLNHWTNREVPSGLTLNSFEKGAPDWSQGHQEEPFPPPVLLRPVSVPDISP